MPPAPSMPPLYYFFWFSHLPKCSDNPALVVLVHCLTLHPSCAPQHLQLKEWRVWTRKQLESHQRVCWPLLLLANVGSTKEKTPGRMLRCCFMAKYLELFSRCPSSALTWPWLFVPGVVAVLLESTYYTIPKWRTQSPFQRTRSTDYLCV